MFTKFFNYIIPSWGKRRDGSKSHLQDDNEDQSPLDEKHPVTDGIDPNNSEKMPQDQEDEKDDDNPAKVELSLCSHLICRKNESDLATLFEENKVPFEDFAEDPLKILENPNLLVRFDNKLYQWRAAAPLMLSLLAYNTPLPSKVMENLVFDKKHAKHNSRSNPSSPKGSPPPLEIMIPEFNLDQEPEKPRKTSNCFHSDQPTSAQLEELPLHYGENEIEFIVSKYNLIIKNS